MRNLFVTAAAVAALLATGTLTTTSDAKTLAAPAGVHKTTKTVKAGKSFKAHKSFARAHVVCRRGWHHRHGRCFRVR